jgi:Leucine-rich repeat (LRR) protein
MNTKKILNEKSLKELYVKNNAIALDLSSKRITKIEPSIFNNKKYSNLISLNLSHNKLTEIELKTFDGLNSLEYLYLQNNKIIIIEQGAFNALSNLKVLVLGENNITTLKAGSFTGLYNLERLNLCDNKFEVIEPGAFSELYSLKYLYLFIDDVKILKFNSFLGFSNRNSNNLNITIYDKNIDNVSDVSVDVESIIYYDKIYNLSQNIRSLEESPLIRNNNVIKAYLQSLEILVAKLGEENIIKTNNNNMIKTIINEKKIKNFFKNTFKKTNRKINNSINTIELKLKNGSLKFSKNNKIINESEVLRNIFEKNFSPNRKTIEFNNYEIENIDLIQKYYNSNNKIKYLNKFNDLSLISFYSIVNFLDIRELQNELFCYILNKIIDYDNNEIGAFFQLKFINNKKT